VPQYFEEMYADGRALSIAVSNYCPCQIECLTADPTATVPAVNQLNYHVGMGGDPSGMVTDDYNLQVRRAGQGRAGCTGPARTPSPPPPP
jgi:hypothetical protein